MLELDYFLAHPDTAWPVIKEIFYDHFGKAQPNAAHLRRPRAPAMPHHKEYRFCAMKPIGSAL